jgi:hypothetical protein
MHFTDTERADEAQESIRGKGFQFPPPILTAAILFVAEKNTYPAGILLEK